MTNIIDIIVDVPKSRDVIIYFKERCQSDEHYNESIKEYFNLTAAEFQKFKTYDILNASAVIRDYNTIQFVKSRAPEFFI